VADFVWHGRPESTRGPKPAFTLDQIADAAIAVADADGLAAVSMQRVAAELGRTKMALYRYVPGKAELISAMLERGLGHLPDISERDGWRPALAKWSESLLAAYLGHPWAVEATVGERPVGPNELQWMELALSVLPAGLTGAERMDVVATLAAHVRGMVAPAAHQERGMTEAIGVAMREQADRFPAVAAAVADLVEHGGGDQAFRFGLDRILDGLDVLVTRRTQTGVRNIQVG
jgi:AcrR family transcriptional regulator